MHSLAKNEDLHFNFLAQALGPDWRDAELRCIHLQQLLVGYPSAGSHVRYLNEVLLQAFSRALVWVCSAAAGRSLHPNFGNWLDHPSLATILPKRSTGLRMSTILA
jgi:hypothetical protein